MNPFTAAKNLLTGKTASGLDRNFAHALGEYVRKHPDRCAAWKKANPDKPLPLVIDPRTGDLTWANRKSRRS